MKTKLPKNFKSLMWSYNFSKMNIENHEQTVIIQTLNYGDDNHLKWIIKNIGEQKIKENIKSLAKSVFSKKGLETIANIFKIKEFRFKTRGEQVHYLMHRDKNYKDILKIIDQKFKK